MKLSQLLQERQAEMELTVGQLAKMCNVGYPRMRQWLEGRRRPNFQGGVLLMIGLGIALETVASCSDFTMDEDVRTINRRLQRREKKGASKTVS